LLVDDDVAFARSLTSYAKARGCDMEVAPTLQRAAPFFSGHNPPDLILLDLGLPDGCGLDLIERVPPESLSRLIVLTGDPSAETAHRAQQFPIMDYMVKPLRQHRLDDLFLRAGEHARARWLRHVGNDARGLLLGGSRRMREVRAALSRIAPYEDAVLLTGASGTGKELAARALHQLSGRTGAFVAVNCGASSAELLGSHLFGHVRGSFTGAIRDHRGYFEQAAGGTLFLDEITEMPVELQPYLLRVLESRTVTPLGSTLARQTEVRIVAACNVDPQRAMERGHLRPDLYYRLAQFPVQMPTLAERPGDIATLAQSFVDAFNAAHGTARRLTDGAVAVLQGREWPGNVRELKHAIRRACILCGHETIEARDVMEMRHGASLEEDAMAGTLEQIERRAILRTLAKHDDNKTLAAQELGISVKTIYNKLERYRDRL
jgi:DNA-binding NtrC family response regulator